MAKEATNPKPTMQTEWYYLILANLQTEWCCFCRSTCLDLFCLQTCKSDCFGKLQSFQHNAILRWNWHYWKRVWHFECSNCLSVSPGRWLFTYGHAEGSSGQLPCKCILHSLLDIWCAYWVSVNPWSGGLLPLGGISTKPYLSRSIVTTQSWRHGFLFMTFRTGICIAWL